MQYTTVRQSMSYQHRPVQLSTTTQSTNTTIELSDCSAMKMCNIEQTHAITLVSVLTVGANNNNNNNKNECHSNIIVDKLQGCSHSKKLRESESESRSSKVV